LISAIAFDEVMANQLVEGGVDAAVFEHFLFRLLEYIRTQKRYQGKRIVLLMDNATIHRHANCIATVMDMRAILFFNPPYSPQLNPVEVFFKRLKTFIKNKLPRTRYAI
jgi:transposase